MKTTRKVLLSVLAIGVLGSLAVLGAFGAFSETTTNAGNEFKSGSVTFSDNDNGSALYSVSNAKPGDTVISCIKATYTGSLSSDVELYMPDTVGALAQYVDLTITPGTQASSTFPSCTGFTPSADGVLYTGTLQNFAATHSSLANGLGTDPAGQTTWNTNDSVVYKFQVTLNAAAPPSAEAQSTGENSFVWDAQSN
jgi:hypothetical protein